MEPQDEEGENHVAAIPPRAEDRLELLEMSLTVFKAAAQMFCKLGWRGIDRKANAGTTRTT